MRKVYLLAVSFFIFLLSFNISSITPNVAFAQEIGPTPVPQSNYELPYPGLLPDHPLYVLKVIRDKFVSLLISDPKKKAEFNLLQADKRLNAGIYLFNSAEKDLAKKNEKKINLAISTISKAENYFEEALSKAKEAKNQGAEVTEMMNRLIDSSRKHREVLRSLAEKSQQKFKANFELQLQRVSSFEKEAIAQMLK